MKCHCNAELEKKINEKSGEYYECPICHCKYKLCLVQKSLGCAKEKYEQKISSESKENESKVEEAKGRFYCMKCKGMHNASSKKGEKHWKYRRNNNGEKQTKA